MDTGAPGANFISQDDFNSIDHACVLKYHDANEAAQFQSAGGNPLQLLATVLLEVRVYLPGSGKVASQLAYFRVVKG